MPPSSNEQYWVKAFMVNGKPMGKIASSKELTQYVKDMEAWRLRNLVLVNRARQFVKEILLQQKMIRIDRYVAFEHSKFFTLKGAPKKIDATNRIKAFDDCLADILQLDDSLFWSSYVEKIETVESNPYVTVVIKSHEPRGMRDLSKESL